ncbi:MULTISPECIES: hypothetical protein [Pantoea]|jgi:hypothetical protein|uniref:hypothetical protein n=1 Tax=Pantoea TaxID=53335 RepID=UPI000EA3B746|nr:MULTISPECIES: hypothetical protein [Pantoea]MBZ6385542.1 hypothetical protein [Pantoea piersonii]MBZ6398914.1 hypothetical protein [Pantoea piersonii]MBZ6407588.1 hypothetical protein [Pantoea piersonii]MBZ6425461.1 hypothetical protein [Pantoea piersonii]NYB01016.1 hypothetical protein [Pantoea piersonii]
MTLEQRIEALEKKVANLTMPNDKAEELAKMMRDVAAETIKNARRPGGLMDKPDQEAATLMAAKLATRKLLAEQAE